MWVRGIALTNFRNYPHLRVNFHPSLNIIIGKNAQGKTNILEAIFYALTGKSHRTNYDNALIHWGQKESKVTLVGERSLGQVKVEILIKDDGKKVLKVNNHIKKKFSELLGTIRVVLFSPEDMLLVKGGPSIRRRFLDIEISQISPVYCQNLVNYNKIVVQRNNLLKAIRDHKEDVEHVEIWDQQLVNYGIQIIKKRAEVVQKLSGITSSIHSKITENKEKLELAYLPSVKSDNKNNNIGLDEFFLQKLKENRKLEIIRGVTLIGPHKDDLSVTVNGIDLKAFGSQGQQRTSALSLKLSEIEFIKAETGEYPVLLLDDVMSELDLDRRKFLLELVMDQVQTFVTSTGMHDIIEPISHKGAVYEACAGKITLIQEE